MLGEKIIAELIIAECEAKDDRRSHRYRSARLQQYKSLGRYSAWPSITRLWRRNQWSHRGFDVRIPLHQPTGNYFLPGLPVNEVILAKKDMPVSIGDFRLARDFAVTTPVGEVSFECSAGRVHFDASRLFARFEGLAESHAVWNATEPAPRSPFFETITRFDTERAETEIPPNVQSLTMRGRGIRPEVLRELPELDQLIIIGATDEQAIAVLENWPSRPIRSLVLNSSDFATNGRRFGPAVTAAFNASPAKETLAELHACFPIDAAAARGKYRILIAAGGLLSGAARELGPELHSLVVYASDVVSEVVDAPLRGLSTLIFAHCDLRSDRLSKLECMTELTELTTSWCGHDEGAALRLLESPSMAGVPLIALDEKGEGALNSASYRRNHALSSLPAP